MVSDNLIIEELGAVSDDLLLPWLDLYETTFSVPERVLTSTILGILRDKSRKLDQNQHLLALLEPPRQLIGMAWYELFPEKVAFLWYMALAPDKQGQGIGSQFYREIVQRVAPPAKVLFIELEIPENAGSEEQRQYDLRRMQFYRRLGVLRLSGIHYLQFVGEHQPLTPMHLMVHPFEHIDAPTAFRLARSVLGESICQIGPLVLE